MRTMNSLRWTCGWMVGVLLGLGLVLGGTVASAQLYAASEDLWTIDLSTGEGTAVGPFGVSTITSLAYDEASQQLFGYRSGSTGAQRSLQVIDVQTGEATQVGPSGGPAISGMTYDPITDTLYAANFSAGKLYTLDRVSGLPTEIGPIPNVAALAFDLSTRMLFGTDRSSDLYAIDPATGDGTLIGPTGFSDVQGLTFDRTTNTLYGVEWISDSLLTIDVTTGEATAVGTVGSASSLRGLAFAPPPPPPSGLYAASDDLWTIDLSTGEGTTVGPFGVSTITSLAYDEASQQLFAYRSGVTGAQRSLQVIDAKTGEASQVGPSGGPAISGMTYDPITDTLFAASFSTGKLYTLDKANGTPTEIGSAPNVAALAFDLSTRMLYGTDRSSDLYAIDPATGDGTLIGPTGFSDVQGLTFDRTTNTLYGVEWTTDSLLTIDVTTGEATAVGTVGSTSSLRGLAFAPVFEPVAHCGVGSVNAACGSISDVLFINGLTGGDHRIVETIDATMPVSFQISEAPSRIGDGAPTRVCLYVWIGEPELDDVVAAPANLGTMCFGPLPTATRTPRRVFNSIGAAGKLGAHSSPQPIPLVPDGELLDFSTRPQGTRRPLTVTIQGFIEDDCSRGDVPYSVTNGVVLRVL